jgi:hypothetical protein
MSLLQDLKEGMREYFGPSKDDVWRQLADRIGGTFKTGNFWSGSAVETEYGEWTLRLDTFTVSSGNSSQTYTRMRTPFFNPDHFRFQIKRAHFLTGLFKAFGMEDIEIGVGSFDRNFVISSNDPDRIRALFIQKDFRDFISVHPHLTLSVKDDEGIPGRSYGPDVDALSLVVPGVIKELPRLHAMFMLTALLLDALCADGESYKNRDPKMAWTLDSLAMENQAEVEVLDALSAVTHWLGADPEKTSDGYEARFVLDDTQANFNDPKGRILATLPELPENVTELKLSAPIPDLVDHARILPVKGIMARLANMRTLKTGDSDLDNAVIIEGQEKDTALFTAAAPYLIRLSALPFQIEISSGRLSAEVKASRSELAEAAQLLIQTWQAFKNPGLLPTQGQTPTP